MLLCWISEFELDGDLGVETADLYTFFGRAGLIVDRVQFGSTGCVSYASGVGINPIQWQELLPIVLLCGNNYPMTRDFRATRSHTRTMCA